MIADMPITERMGKVVDAVRASMLTYLKGVDRNIETIRYDHGSELNIVNRTIILNDPPRFQFQKYPLIALNEAFKERGNPKAGGLRTVSLEMIVANQSKIDLTEAQRYTQNFNPIITPITDELILQITESAYFFNVFLIPERSNLHAWKAGTDFIDCTSLRFDLTLPPALSQCQRSTKFF